MMHRAIFTITKRPLGPFVFSPACATSLRPCNDTLHLLLKTSETGQTLRDWFDGPMQNLDQMQSIFKSD